MVIIKIVLLIVLFIALVYAIAWVFQGITERNGARGKLRSSPYTHRHVRRVRHKAITKPRAKT